MRDLSGFSQCSIHPVCSIYIYIYIYIVYLCVYIYTHTYIYIYIYGSLWNNKVQECADQRSSGVLAGVFTKRFQGAQRRGLLSSSSRRKWTIAYSCSFTRGSSVQCEALTREPKRLIKRASLKQSQGFHRLQNIRTEGEGRG